MMLRTIKDISQGANMAKTKSAFFFFFFGYDSGKWLGQCPVCHQWDTFVEEKITKSTAGKVDRLTGEVAHSVLLSDVTSNEHDRITTGMEELDRVLGGGIVKGSLVLVGGDPGIGKSTLLLQMCLALAGDGVNVLYVSGEESPGQIKMRADRLHNAGKDIRLFSETNLDRVETVIENDKPDIVIIDSIQTMYREDVASAPGSVGQVRETTSTLMKLAKIMGITIFIIGHVTKEGVVAGPRVLEHMVDTVLYFEGENQVSYRILRAVKNRFGSTNEIGVFEMCQKGLMEVSNPSEYMLMGKPEEEAGSVVTCALEGTRPIMIEVQALVCRTNFNLPRRTSAGTDYNRLNLLMAVLERRIGMALSGYDAYVNVAGGMKINEPSLDLAIIAAIISSYKNRPVDNNTIVFGEVGLTGEIRAVSQASNRVNEALKMGYKRVILPKANLKNLDVKGITLEGVDSIRSLIDIL